MTTKSKTRLPSGIVLRRGRNCWFVEGKFNSTYPVTYRCTCRDGRWTVSFSQGGVVAHQALLQSNGMTKVGRTIQGCLDELENAGVTF